MTAKIVCDASALVAALLDSGPDGLWASDRIAHAQLFGPALLPLEWATAMRRLHLSGAGTADQASQAHSYLLDRPTDSWPYSPLPEPVLDLRTTLSRLNDPAIA